VVGEKLRTKGTALAIEGFKQAAEKLNADRYGKVGTGFSPYKKPANLIWLLGPGVFSLSRFAEIVHFSATC
jgi:hypothetical protein